MVLKKRGKGIVEIKVTEDEKELILRCIEFYKIFARKFHWFTVEMNCERKIYIV